MQERFGAYANRLGLFYSAASYMGFYSGSACSGPEAFWSCMYLEIKGVHGLSWRFCNSFFLFSFLFYWFVSFLT